MHDDAVGIVLAGGRSERLAALGLGAGGKAGLVVGGRTCLERVCTAVATVVPRVLVVAAAGQPLPSLPPGVEIVRDSTPDGGPLAGLRDGLDAARAGGARRAFVASCDVPLVRTAVVDRLLAIAESSAAWIVVPVVDGEPQVLAAVFACDLADTVRGHAAAGHGPRAVVAELVARDPAAVRLVSPEVLRDVDPELESFLDLDTPEDLARLESRGIPPSRG
ncbi:MAG: molybdenum cofactor guanylyltransferase [Planctomycetaceae bacterium]